MKTLVGFLTASALVAAMSAGALAAGHSETVIAFDPETLQFSEGVAVDEDGNVYASLSPLGQLVRVAPGADVAETVGSVEGLGEGDIGLLGLAFGPDGAVYGALVSQNPDANGVWRFDTATGAAERVAGTEVISFPNEPSFGDDGTMYVTDLVAGAVWRVPAGGSAESWIGDPLLEGTGDLGYPFPLGPNGIEVAGDTVYVGVSETAQVVAISINDDGTAGTPTTFVQHDSPIDGVAVDAAGNVYTTHPFANEVRRVNADGDIEVVANVDDNLDGPTSVAMGPGAEGETAYIANFTGVPDGGELGAGPSIVSVPTGGDERTDLLLDAATVVTVLDPATTPDFPKGAEMRADCDFMLRMEAEDGSAQEWQSCTLSDEPVTIPENQGVPPTVTITRTTGECEWASDYWFNTDGSMVVASASEVTVTPSGRVFIWSSYPAEPLVCP